YARKIRAVEHAEKRHQERRFPVKPCALDERDRGERRIGEESPQRRRQAEEFRPLAAEYDVADTAHRAAGDRLAAPCGNRQIRGERHPGRRDGQQRPVGRTPKRFFCRLPVSSLFACYLRHDYPFSASSFFASAASRLSAAASLLS